MNEKSELILTPLDVIRLDNMEVDETVIGESGHWTVLRYANEYVICPPRQRAFELDTVEEVKAYLGGKTNMDIREIVIDSSN
jgi:hypothetical protein